LKQLPLSRQPQLARFSCTFMPILEPLIYQCHRRGYRPSDG
jgi:hypothetical protein